MLYEEGGGLEQVCPLVELVEMTANRRIAIELISLTDLIFTFLGVFSRGRDAGESRSRS